MTALSHSDMVSALAIAADALPHHDRALEENVMLFRAHIYDLVSPDTGGLHSNMVCVMKGGAEVYHPLI